MIMREIRYLNVKLIAWVFILNILIGYPCIAGNSNPDEHSRKVKVAEKAINDLAYAKAVRLLEPLNQKQLLNDNEKAMLALSYLKISKVVEALGVYESISEGSLKGVDLFYYAQVLKYNGKYAVADEVMDKYLEDHLNDSRAVRQQQAMSKIKDLLKEKRYEVSPVEFNSAQADFGAVVFEDQVLFTSDREVDIAIKRKYAWNEHPYLNVFSTKDKEGEQADVDLFAEELKSHFHDGPLSIRPDGRQLLLTRSNMGTVFPKLDDHGVNHLKLHIANRVADGSWGPLTELAFNGDGYSTAHGSFSADGKRIYFASDRQGSIGGSDIWYVEKNGDDWSEPVNMGTEINTEGDEMFPVVHKQKLYFTSNGHLGLGGLDLFVTALIDEKYVVKNLGYPMNTNMDDFGIFIREDGHAGFIASNREGGMGDDDIYRFTLLEEETFERKLEATLREKGSGDLIEGLTINVTNIDGNELTTLTADENGKVSLVVPDSVKQVRFSVVDEAYHPFSCAIELGAEENTCELELIPYTEYGITGTLYANSGSKPLEGVEFLVSSSVTDSRQFTSHKDGKFTVRLEADKDYDIEFYKDEYLPLIVRYSTKGKKPGIVDLNEIVDLNMKGLEEELVIEGEILYDFDKSDIRKDATAKLDRVVNFLKCNPDVVVKVSSHTDVIGTVEWNDHLGRRRSSSVADYLMSKGIGRSRIKTYSYGESKPKVKVAGETKENEKQHQPNRRSEIEILKISD